MPPRSVRIGSQVITLDIPPEKLSAGRTKSNGQPLADVQATVGKCLESPQGFPALRQALTPDDHVVILIQEDMNSLPAVLQAILRHIFLTGIKTENVTLLVPPRAVAQHQRFENEVRSPAWFTGLGSEFQACRIEEHRDDQSRIAYLASTKAGRRIYLNRTLVDADQVIILGPVRFDPIFGVASGLADLFPMFSDHATRLELFHSSPAHAEGTDKQPAVWREASTVGWLLGLPFVVTVLEGPGDDILDVWAGSAESVRHLAEKRLRGLRQYDVPAKVDLVIGTISNLPERQTFAQVATGAARASRVTRAGGAVVILSEAPPLLPRGAETMQDAPDPSSGLKSLRHDTQAEFVCWQQLTMALEKAKLYLHSHIPARLLEDLWIIPMDKPMQVKHLIDHAHSVLLVEDLHRALLLLSSQ
jgi:nickel-dependent lactate racemase